MDVLDLLWEHPGIVPNIQKMGFRHGLPIIASLSCRPNAYVRAVEEHRYNEAINIHPTALSNAHRLALMAASRGDHFGMKRDIDVMPFGVSFKEASFSADSLAQSKETPENPLLRALQNSGKDYFLHAASINKEKGQSSTITLFKEAQKAGLDDAVLVLAGTPDKQSPDAMDYWRTEIEPHIDRNGVIYVGELNEAEKWEYMKFARATIFCSGIEARYVEAYGRVLAESAGSGAPVVGIKSNTFREIMEEGITGLGFTTIAEGAQKLLDVALLNRTRCKEYAREHMSNDRFVMQMGKLCTYMAETRKYFYRSYEDERPFPTYQPDISYVERGKDADPYEAYEELRCGWRYAHVSTAPHHASRYSVGSRLAETSVSLVDHYGLDLSLSSDEAWRFVDGCKYSCKGHSFFDGYMATSC